MSSPARLLEIGRLQMNIIVAGGGKVGELLSVELTNEGNNITLIEKNEKKLERLVYKNDITGVIGNCVDYNTLVEAQVEDGDIFIAVTSEDELNIIACIIAQKLGAKHTIARVRNPEYSAHIDFMENDLNISLMINPEKEAAEDIMRVIQYPEALSIEEFANGRVNLSELLIKENSPLIDVRISDFRQRFGNILVTVVLRDGQTLIPSGQTVLKEGDEIYVVSTKEKLNEFYAKVNGKVGQIKTALIIGGGRITHYLIGLLLDKGVKVKVIEQNTDAAKSLSSLYPKCVVVEGDGTDQSFLEEERIGSYDAVISLTGVDESNILTSMFAMTFDPKKVITKVSRTDLLRIMSLMGSISLQTIVTPKRLIAYKIIRYVRALKYHYSSHFENFFRVANNQAEAMQFEVGSESKIINIPLIDLKLKDDLLIAFIVRGDDLLFPTGADRILPGDKVIVVTTRKVLDEIDEILK